MQIFCRQKPAKRHIHCTQYAYYLHFCSHVHICKSISPLEFIMCSSGLFQTALCNSMSFVDVLIINLLDFLCSGSFEQLYLQRRPYSRIFSLFFSVLDQRTTSAGSTLVQCYCFQLKKKKNFCYLILHEVVCYTAGQ